MKASHTAIALGALLGFFALLLLFSKTETEAWPSSFHTGPSGLAALQRLLERDGFQTQSNRSPMLPPNGKNLVIAPVISDKGRGFLSIISRESSSPIDRALARHVAQGGSLLQVQVPLDFNTASRDILKAKVDTPSGSLDVSTNIPDSDAPRMLFNVTMPGTDNRIIPTAPFPLYRTSENPGSSEAQTIARIQTLGEGKAVSLDTGLMAVNRHLGDQQNADLILDIVRRLAPPGTKIVFAEAALGNESEGGLGAALGAWFSAARNQSLVLAAIVCVSLGVRFGRRRPVKNTVKGARDMIDALAAQLASCGDRVYVLKCLASQVESEMKKLEGLAHNSPSTDLLRILPANEREIISYTLDLPANSKISKAEAVRHAQDLERALAFARQRAKERSLIRTS